MGLMAATDKKHDHGIQFYSSSLLAKTFNHLWCNALNARSKGVTHFAMVHADIGPETYWLDKMHAIMSEHKADILSVVAPMKSYEGLTSTGIDGYIDGRRALTPRRFTMREIYAMPHATFTHPDLVINTGLMLVDLTKPWVEEVAFGIADEIHVSDDGKFTPFTIPEDWSFSRQARNRGAIIYATRDVKLEHWGTAAYANTGPWGSLEIDTHFK